MHKISYTIVKKNKYPNAPFYVRVRETGRKPIDVNLETTDRKVAETELMRVKLAASEGSGDPLGALAVRQKELSQPVAKAGGVLEQWEAWMSLAPMESNQWICVIVEKDDATGSLLEQFYTKDTFRHHSLESLQECIEYYKGKG